jgi:hypothetical protein
MTVETYVAQLQTILLRIPPVAPSPENSHETVQVLVGIQKQLRALRSNLIAEARTLRTGSRSISSGARSITRLTVAIVGRHGRRPARMIGDAATIVRAATSLQALSYDRVRIDVENELARVERELAACRKKAPYRKSRRPRRVGL